MHPRGRGVRGRGARPRVGERSRGARGGGEDEVSRGDGAGWYAGEGRSKTHVEGGRGAREGGEDEASRGGEGQGCMLGEGRVTPRVRADRGSRRGGEGDASRGGGQGFTRERGGRGLAWTTYINCLNVYFSGSWVGPSPMSSRHFPCVVSSFQCRHRRSNRRHPYAPATRTRGDRRPWRVARTGTGDRGWNQAHWSSYRVPPGGEGVAGTGGARLFNPAEDH